jgi:hypothetical protein
MARAGLVYGLMRAGSREEAMAAAKDLIIAADTIPNPWAHSYALLTYGIAWCDADPLGARDALQRGLVMAQESGNRYNESHLANIRPTKSGRSGSVNVTANTALKTETVTLSAACLFPVPVLSSASQVAPLAEHRPIHDFAPMAPPEGVRSARASDGPDQ